MVLMLCTVLCSAEVRLQEETRDRVGMYLACHECPWPYSTSVTATDDFKKRIVSTLLFVLRRLRGGLLVAWSGSCIAAFPDELVKDSR